MDLQTSSDTVFHSQKTTLYLDLKNNMVQDAKNVLVDVFENSLLKKLGCKPDYFGSIPAGDLRQGELKIITCEFLAPSKEELPEEQVITDIFASARFDSKLQASQLVKLISQDEYEVRQRTGNLGNDPKTYAYRDDNIELTVDFSSQLPIVSRDNREFVTFKIRNIGSGFVKEIKLGEDFKLLQNPEFNGKKLVNEICMTGTIELLDDEFPAITCELQLPEINYLSNTILIINIDYQYEIRASLPVRIIR